jgi:CspA family cold shock protein
MSATETIRTTGQVKWFSAQKGYGFIVGSDGEDVFFHFSAIQMDGYKTVEDGAEVQFELHKGRDGKRLEAKSVVVV